MTKKTLVVVAHPDLSKSRINAAWTAALEAHAPGVTIHRLYEACPRGKIDVTAEQALIRAHDRVIFQFPMFWFSTPALLKQWFDEVLTSGFVYGPGGDALEGKAFGVAVSTGGKAEAYHAGGQTGFTLDELLRPIQQTAAFCRAVYLPIFTLQGAAWGVSDEAVTSSARHYIDYVVPSAGVAAA